MKSIFKKIITKIIQFESRLVLKKYNPKVVAVTGSVGKTSTKDAIFSVMSGSFYVRKSEKSFNSDIGIPLTILGCPNAWSNPFKWLNNIWEGLRLIIWRQSYPEWLILEVGADRPGDIKNISKWLRPDVVVLTRFAQIPVHIEFFKNRDEIIKEKWYLVDALKYDGVLIANADDVDAMKMTQRANTRILKYGLLGDADIKASNIEIHYEEKTRTPDGMIFKVGYLNNSVPIIIKYSLGMQSIYSSLAAISVGLSQDVNLVKAGEGLLKHESPKGRMRILLGIKNTTILDDTYNSSPVALHSALKALKDIKTKARKIAVLADMMELGKHSTEEHYEAGKLVAESSDILMTVGVRSRRIAEGALDNGLGELNVFQFDNSVEAGTALQDILREGDIILIKGSQSTRMERTVEEVMAEPEKAEELLVRQEEEWKKR
ncbi:MAG: UDP-N-acetylmuramoyl-tripeptide--D-alanyl-D-alanine ligase [Candidatus Paceibacterota bacterium]|jgi:UDP-N-acetylmuramoyl-tripeptide--D-alanyl-D-alanine ligase